MPYSGENVMVLSKSSIKGDVEYKAIYSCVGFLAVRPSLGTLDVQGNADRITFKQFKDTSNISIQNDILLSVKYSFEAGRGFETNLTASTIIQLDTDEIVEVSGNGKINFADLYVNTGDVWFVKLYIKDGVDPYNYTAETDENADDDDEADAVVESPDDACVTVFIMGKQTLGENSFVNKCFSIQNQKTEGAESKTFSIRLKTVA